MTVSAVLANESQLGREGALRQKHGHEGATSGHGVGGQKGGQRSGGQNEITRPSLMEELTARGVRITRQRRVLVQIIQDSPRHLDARGLLKLAQKAEPDVNLATVYRTLTLLKKKGLIDELDLMHLHGEKHFYEAKTSSDHCHMACFGCGAIMEYASALFEKLKKQISGDSGFHIKVARLELGGLCERCSKAKSHASPSAQGPGKLTVPSSGRAGTAHTGSAR
jgi:Fe2+ or Zn2+ uptake regulation protein